MTQIGFVISKQENERRRAILPNDIKKLKAADQLVFEAGYGEILGLNDQDYIDAGATVAGRNEVLQCPIICNPKPQITDEYFMPNKVLFGWVHAVQGRAIVDRLLENKMTAIAWEDMFEGHRHTFWRNNEISGEAALLHAFLEWGRLPYECSVAVIGRGNAARGATRTLERYGCNVMVYDRKTSPLLRRELDRYDVIVNAVLWDVFRDDHLIYESDLDHMRPGSLIIDISCDEGMGVETCRATTIQAPVYMHKGIMHYAVDHTPSLLYKSASDSLSAAAWPFIDCLAQDKENDVLKEATIVREGRILDERIVRYQGRK